MVISTLRRIVFFGSVCIFLGSAGGGCGNQEKRQKPVLTEEVPKITVERVVADTTGQKEDSGTERRMRQLGLVDIGEVDPTIAVHLVYATSDNFAVSGYPESISVTGGRRAFSRSPAKVETSEAGIESARI